MVTGILELFFELFSGNHGNWDFRAIFLNFKGIVKVYECNFDQSDGWIS